ncbi:antiholin-like murein hydrolase modulator LrgA [Vagococcus intermedius]|uniref:Antiholin-like murein hydrolase modulator LrgA n=1 Tax=Vagococcus intermedius TaxID=2991418 RepID=A0AAF0CWB8_9ENTE|nr:antiholin-like murein hydrolase modulator LrgA [Vagococcus intermedius]WEG73897.1 antiholin-like murein hydrolase modulator LrgA [Vagococcus intermedius]WEG75981.1 antiholin-like murein hydrolase modulator LrgA [Vagococcus intermedius]
MSKQKYYSFLEQAFVFAAIMLLSNIIIKFLPFPMPASVMGLILLFIALCTKVVKLEQVEGLGTSLTGLISFLFVPSGISVINSLGIMGEYGVQIVAIIIIATVILLAVTGWSASALLKLRDKHSGSLNNVKEAVKTSTVMPNKQLEEVK